MCSSFFALCAEAQQFGVGDYQVISVTRVGRTDFEYVMRANLTNQGFAALDVTARVTSTSPRTVVVRDSASFGNVPFGGTVTSTNTFAVRIDRTYAFEPTNLQWAVSAQRFLTR